MKRLLISGLLLTSLSSATIVPTPSQKILYEGHHWFELRDALVHHDGSPLYKGAVASAFDQKPQAETFLNEVIATSPHSDEAYQAHERLFDLYFRQGLYPQAVAQIQAKLAARPDRNNTDEQSLITAFQRLPNQETGHFRPSHLRYSILKNYVELPLKVNGKPVQFYLDSDANVSTMSASQAAQLGITVNQTDAKDLGSTGAGAGFSIGVASKLQIGDIHLRNVAFMIFPDDQEPFKSYPLGRRGFVGIPVLRALKTLHWTKGGALDVGFHSTLRKTSANLCYDGSDPVTEIGYEGSKIDVVLDTGSRLTNLWPPFADKFPSVIKIGERASMPMMGLGGRSNIDSITLPKVVLVVGGFNSGLQPAHLLLEPTTPNSGWYYARLGIDTLNQAESVTIDFESMTLSLQ